jgi:periplasmic protein CpxP/Spy
MRWTVLACALASGLAISASGAMGAPARPPQRPSERSPERPVAVSADLLRLHDDLQLSEGQEAGWRDYTQAIAPDPQVEARHRATADLLPAVPTPRRIALMQATMESDAVDFRRHATAVIAFYNQLTPAQQRTFDQETAPRAQDERAEQP